MPRGAEEQVEISSKIQCQTELPCEVPADTITLLGICVSVRVCLRFALDLESAGFACLVLHPRLGTRERITLGADMIATEAAKAVLLHLLTSPQR
jgi:hypothetical protein